MQSLDIQLKSEGDFAQLRYRLPGKLEYETKSLKLSEIEDLYGFADRDFETRLPDLGAIGKRLFLWLDGDGRWLSRVTESARGVVLAIDASSSTLLTGHSQLAGLPWETMQDGQGFLVNRCIVPVRVVGGFGATNPSPEVSQYRLQTLFMATEPEGIEPRLDFEGEESRILAATQDLPIELRVEESGCLSELTSLWRRFPEDYFHVFHLTGHASIRDREPYFITESLTGDRVDATVDDFDRVFQLRYPRLMFLSGCRTGQSINGGAVPSLAASLVEKGAAAVLGWARPVSDTGATQAATELYRSLAQGLSIAEALGLTYQALIRDGVKDWCLLRLYARVDAWGALVLPPGDTIVQQRKESKLRFLDRRNLIRVAGADEFVGRRRYLQRGLRALKSSQNLGIWLHGIGGVGKSTIACRLLDRLGAYQSVVCYRDFDETVLLNLLSRECESSQGHEILNGNLPLPQKLSQFLKQGLNTPDQRYLFILDDFEANLEERGDGAWVLNTSVVETLTALLTAIDRSQLPHRVMITSRYDVNLPEFNSRLTRFQVDRLDRSDVAKKYKRLKAFQAGSTVDRELQIQAKSIADGYPRLLEWLDKVLQDDRTDSTAILAAMAGKQQEFLEDILAAKLLAQQEPALLAILTRGLIFELPVPLVALQAICEGIGDFHRHLERARSVGLLEVSLNGAVRVPRVLGLAVAENEAELAAIGVKGLLREWGKVGYLNEDQSIELHRLSLLAEDKDVAVSLAQNLSNSWLDRGRYSEALKICKNTLALWHDGNIICNLSRVYDHLNDWGKSLELAGESLNMSCENRDRQNEAASLHQIALIYSRQGKWDQSIQTYKTALNIYYEIEDWQGVGASLHQIAAVYYEQGQLDKALEMWNIALIIAREIPYWIGVSNALNQITSIYMDREEWKRSLESCFEALDISIKIKNQEGEASALGRIGSIYTKQGKWTEALKFHNDSLEISQNIGDRGGEAACFHEMAHIADMQGDIKQRDKFYLAAIAILFEIGDHNHLFVLLCNFGIAKEDISLSYYAQALWLSLRLETNLSRTIELIEAIYHQVPTADLLKSLLAGVALYFCQDSPHPDLVQLQERSLGMLSYTADQQGIANQEQFDEWIVQNRLDDPNYYLPALDARLVEIIGDDWLFDPQQVPA
jgi:tetratricopeptide (TPR) repeat protein